MKNIFCSVSMTNTSIPYHNNFLTLVKENQSCAHIFCVLNTEKFFFNSRSEFDGHVVLTLGWLNLLLTLVSSLSSKSLVININNPVLGLFMPVFIFARLTGARIVYTQHTPFKNLKLSNKLFSLLCMLSAYQIHCVSRVVKSSTPKYFVSKSAVLYNCVPLSVPVYSVPPKRLNHLISVGRLVDLKGWKDFLHLSKNNFQLFDRFQWIGSGPRFNQATLSSYEFGKNKKIEFLGDLPRDEVYANLLKSDTYVSFSKWEGFGVAVIEALYFCDHVYLSSIPAHVEIVKMVGSGHVFSDLSDLVNAIIYDRKKCNFPEMSPHNKRRERIDFLFSERRYAASYRRLVSLQRPNRCRLFS